jgi:hypothetical protein
MPLWAITFCKRSILSPHLTSYIKNRGFPTCPPYQEKPPPLQNDSVMAAADKILIKSRFLQAA